MSLQTLAEVVFRRGCNVDLEYMLQSDAYRELLKEARDLNLVAPEDSALAQLLGATLADRAFQNMPWSIRSKIDTWHDGLDAQMALLQLVYEELNGEKWRTSETRQYAYNSDERCVLPAETGSWTDGPARPNCLGLAQMMVGFARAVGARHYLANVLRPNQDTLHALKTRLLKTTADMLRTHSYLDEFTAKIDKRYVEALERTNTDHQAHHVLVIQTADGTWWVVDPYLRALYSLRDNPHRTQALAQLAVDRNKALTTDNQATSINEHLAKIEMRLRIVDTMCLLIKRSDELLLNDLSHLVAFSWLCQEPITDRHELARTLAFIQVESNPEQAGMASLALVCAVDEEVNDPIEMSVRLGEAPQEVMARLTASQQRAKTDPNYKLHMATRLVRFVLQDVLEHIDELNQRDDVRYHGGLEIGWAPMALGVATLNHMQFEDANSRPPLRGRLATLFKSQWVIYDALAIAKQQGEPIDPSLLAEWETHLARFDDAPDLVIVPLHLLRRK
jgi:hypothetical protein